VKVIERPVSGLFDTEEIPRKQPRAQRAAFLSLLKPVIRGKARHPGESRDPRGRGDDDWCVTA